MFLKNWMTTEILKNGRIKNFLNSLFLNKSSTENFTLGNPIFLWT